MSHLTEQFFAETGDKKMYRMRSSDYRTSRYVKWLEAKVENGFSHNRQSIRFTCLKCDSPVREIDRFCWQCGYKFK